MQGLMKKVVTLSAAAALLWLVASSAMQTPRVAAAPAGGSGLPFSEELAHLGDQIFDDRNLSVGRNQACNCSHQAKVLATS